MKQDETKIENSWKHSRTFKNLAPEPCRAVELWQLWQLWQLWPWCQAVDPVTSVTPSVLVAPTERSAVRRRPGALWALCHLGDAAVQSDINCSEASNQRYQRDL